MSVLTRIKNNQITDSTILANTKIAPGTIVGSLFNANLTMTSDVTITGNLTVQGSSTYLTVASTNTYVNDPLIVMNNAFSGTNTYDLGFIFNRGSLTTAALVWDEGSDEFRFGYTTETGTTYGSINNSGYANVKVGNITVTGLANIGSISMSGDIGVGNVTAAGDVAVNGGDLTTSQSSFNLVNTTATTLNIGGSATTLNLGATSGTASLLNANIWMPNATTVDGAQATVGLFNLATTVDAFKAATDLELGATTGTLTINNPTVVGTQTTQNLYNTTATTVNAFGAATTLVLGATTGTANIRNATTNLVGNATVGGTLSVTGNITAPRLLSSSAQLQAPTIGDYSGERIRLYDFADTGKTNYAIGVEGSHIWMGVDSSLEAQGFKWYGNTTQVMRLSAAGNLYLWGSSTVTGNITAAGDLAVNGGNLTTTAGTFNLLDTNATTVNAFGAATAIDLGATTGTLTINNPAIVGSQVTQDLFNTTATTLNFAGAATSLTIGATSGTVTLRNALVDIDGNATVGGTLGVTGDTTLTGDLAVNGGDVTTTATTFNLLNSTVQTANVLGGANLITIGTTSGSTNIRNNLNVSLTIEARDINNTVIGNTAPAAGTFTSLTDQSLTSGRIVVAGSGGDLGDSANLTFTGDTLSVLDVSIDGGSKTLSTSSGNLVINSAGGEVDVSGAVLANVADPVASQDAVTLNYLNTALSSAVSNLVADDSFLTLTDDGINPGDITANVDGVEVVKITTGETTFYTGFVTLDDANAAVSVTGDITATGDLAVNGGDLTTTQTTFNLIDSTATTVNFAGAATTLDIGGATGTVTINNGNVWLPNATTINSAANSVNLLTSPDSSINAFTNAIDITIGKNLDGQTLIDSANTKTAGNLTVQSTEKSTNASTGALVVGGGVGVGGNLNVAGDVVITGNLQVDGAVTSVNTTTLDVEDLNITVAKGAASAAAANGAGLTVDGANATFTYANADDSWNLNKLLNGTSLELANGATVGETLSARDINSTVIGNTAPAAGTFTQINATQNVSAAVSGSIALNANTAFTIVSTTTGTIDNFNIGATTAGTGAFTALTSTGNTSLGLTTAGAINNTPIGNATASTGAFTTLTASGVTQITDATAATGAGTGAFRVTGGASVGGNLYVGGNINIVGSSYVLTGNAGVFYGDANGFGALYAGVTGYAQLPSTVLQTSADINNYAQNNFENVNTGAKASTDWVATAGDGSDYDHYIDMGIVTSNWDGTQDNSLTNALGANDGYMYVQGNVTTGQGGNLVVGASTPGTKKVSVIVGGNTASNITAVFNNPGTQSTGRFSGALTVTGGVGVLGNVNANNITLIESVTAAGLTLSGDAAINGGDLTTTAGTFNLVNANATTVNFAGAATALNLGAATGTTTVKNNLDVDLSLNARDINNTVIGNVTPAAGTFTTLNAGSLSVSSINGTEIGNVTPSTGAFTTLSSSGNTSLGLTSATAINNTPIGNATPSTGAFTTLTASGTANVGPLTATSINGTVIGNVVPAAAAFTTLTSSGTTGLGLTSATAINSTPIGNATPSTGAFTTLSTSGTASVGNILYANAGIASTNYSNGAVVVNGGIGVDGNINIRSGKILTVGIDDPSANVSFPERQIVAIGNINAAAGMNLRNLSSGNVATTNYVAVADNNVGESNFVTLSIAGSGFNIANSIIKANDAFISTAGGNLNIIGAGVGKDINISTSTNEDNLIVKVSADYSNVKILSNISSTTSNTGALTVVGGVGIGGALNVASNATVANGAVINSSQSFDNFTVKGTAATTLIHADSAQGAVIIGGSNATPTYGAVAKFNANTSIQIPVGSTADRPGNSGNVDVVGMLRFNSSTVNLEYYTGTAWEVAGSDSTFTIITSDQFTGNGSANVYTLSGNTTTNGTIVTINGITQLPTVSYSITGNTLTFSEPPADGDLIDVRILTTTSTAGAEVASSNGQVAFTPTDADGAQIFSGAGAKTLRAVMTTNGVWTYKSSTKTAFDPGSTSVSSANVATEIDRYSVTSYTSAKYIVQVRQGAGNLQVMEALVTTDGTNAYVTTYGIVDSNGQLGTLSANVQSSNVILYYTSSTLSNSNVKVATTYIA